MLSSLSRPALDRKALTSGLALAALGLCFALAGAPVAHAALISTDACDDSTLSTAFAAWGDANQYKAAPNGDLQDGAAGWTLSGGAHTVSGSEPQNVSGASNPTSIVLPAGSSAQSPPTCVDAAYPSYRFFARNDGLLAGLSVSAVYTNVLGLTVPLPLGVAAPSGQWSPSSPMLTGSAVTGLLTGGTTMVSLRFTELLGTSQVADVYVDPWQRH